MYGAYFSYRFVVHKYTVIVSASSFSALFSPQPDKSDITVTIARTIDKALFHFLFFIRTPPLSSLCIFLLYNIKISNDSDVSILLWPFFIISKTSKPFICGILMSKSIRSIPELSLSSGSPDFHFQLPDNGKFLRESPSTYSC